MMIAIAISSSNHFRHSRPAQPSAMSFERKKPGAAAAKALGGVAATFGMAFGGLAVITGVFTGVSRSLVGARWPCRSTCKFLDTNSKCCSSAWIRFRCSD